MKYGLPAISRRPHALGRGPQPLVDFDVAPSVDLHPHRLQPNPVGIRGASSGDEQVRPVDMASRCLKADGLAGLPLDAVDSRADPYLDPLVAEELLDRLGDVLVFAVDEGGVALDDRHAAAEASEGLCQFQPHVAAAEDDQMFGEPIQLQGFDMG